MAHLACVLRLRRVGCDGMRVLCLGGGPAGLYFAISMKLRDPSHEVTLLERNAAGATFGWGVVLSDDALGNMERNDPKSTAEIRRHFAYWDDIAVIHQGVRTVSGGHGFAGIGRMRMLQILQDRARELGVEMRFETPFTTAEEYRRDYDLVVACDGINSVVRAEYARRVPPRCRQAPVQVHLARNAPEVRRRVHLHLRADRTRLDVDPRLPVRRRHRDRDRRVHPADLGRVGLRADDEGGDDRHVRARVRAASRRPCVDVECRPSARLGGVDELPADRLRALAPRERRADGRRRGDGALLDRLRHATGVRQRDRPGRVPAQRADDGSGLRALPGRAATRGAPAAVGGAQQPGVVRTGRALPRPRSGAVQLFVAHPVAADLAREPAAPRSGVAAVGGGLVPGSRPGASRAGHRCSRRSGCAVSSSRTVSWCRRWRSTRRSTAAPPTGTSSTTPSAPRAVPAWCTPR